MHDDSTQVFELGLFIGVPPAIVGGKLCWLHAVFVISDSCGVAAERKAAH